MIQIARDFIVFLFDDLFSAPMLAEVNQIAVGLESLRRRKSVDEVVVSDQENGIR